MKKTIPSFTTDKFVEESVRDLVPAYFDSDGVQVSSSIGSDGLEYPDPVPFSPAVPDVPPDQAFRNVIEKINRDEAVQRYMESFDIETEEEANDFDIEDDPLDPLTEYEKVFVPKKPVLNPEPAKEAKPAVEGEGGVSPDKTPPEPAKK